MKYKNIAKILGIKITRTINTTEEFWQVETPISVDPPLFSNCGRAIYRFDSEAEVEAFVSGYSLVMRFVLEQKHTPSN